MVIGSMVPPDVGILLGAVGYLTDDSGAVTDTYGISSYGDVITAGASNKTVNPFTWQGQWGVMQEPGTSLFYLRFRYYDSAFARFLSRDPLFSPAPREINSYQYAAGNPVANGDPAGLKTGNFPSYSFNSLHSSSMLAADLGIPIANTTTGLNDSSELRHLGITTTVRRRSLVTVLLMSDENGLRLLGLGSIIQGR